MLSYKIESFRICFSQSYSFQNDFFQPQKHSEIIASTKIFRASIIIYIKIYQLELIFKSVNIWFLKILQDIEALRLNSMLRLKAHGPEAREQAYASITNGYWQSSSFPMSWYDPRQNITLIDQRTINRASSSARLYRVNWRERIEGSINAKGTNVRPELHLFTCRLILLQFSCE